MRDVQITRARIMRAKIGKLEAENKRLREALKFYADEGSWLDDRINMGADISDVVPHSSPIECDHGQIAITALKESDDARRNAHY